MEKVSSNQTEILDGLGTDAETDINTNFQHLKVSTIRDHPFKTSACAHVPMFADASGGGVLGLPTSAIFEIIRRQISIYN